MFSILISNIINVNCLPCRVRVHQFYISTSSLNLISSLAQSVVQTNGSPPLSPLPGFPSYNAGRGSAGAQNCANQENGWWQYFQSIAGEKTYRNSFVLWSHWGPSSLCSTPRDKKGLRQSVYFIHQGRESITCPQQLSSRSMMERKLILYTWG